MEYYRASSFNYRLPRPNRNNNTSFVGRVDKTYFDGTWQSWVVGSIMSAANTIEMLQVESLSLSLPCLAFE